MWLLWGFSRRAHRRINLLILLINATGPVIHLFVERGIIQIKCRASSTYGSAKEFLTSLHTTSSCAKSSEVFLSFTFAEIHTLMTILLLAGFIGALQYAKKRH